MYKRKRILRLGWRKHHRRPKPQGQVEEDARGLRVLAPAYLVMRKLRHREVKSLSQGIQGWIWNLKLSSGSSHAPSCYPCLSPRVMNSRGIVKPFYAEVWQSQTGFVEQSSWQLWGGQRSETGDQEISSFQSLSFSSRVSDMHTHDKPNKHTNKTSTEVSTQST